MFVLTLETEGQQTEQEVNKELGNEMVTFIFGEVTVDADVKVKMKLARNYTAMIARHRMLTRLRLSHNILFVFFPLVKTVYMSNTTDVL